MQHQGAGGTRPACNCVLFTSRVHEQQQRPHLHNMSSRCRHIRSSQPISLGSLELISFVPTLIALVTRLRRPVGAAVRGAERGCRSGLAVAWREGPASAAAAGGNQEM